MYHAEGIGVGSEAAVIEKPEGDFVIQTRDEEIPFDPEPKTDLRIHIDLDLPKLVESIVDIVRGQVRVARRIRKYVSSPIQADEQQQRIFTPPPRSREVFKPREPKVKPEIPMGGLLQTENPALYVLRTGNNPVGKHLPGKHDQATHGRDKGARFSPERLEMTRSVEDRTEIFDYFSKERGLTPEEYEEALDEHIKKGLRDMPIEIRIRPSTVPKILSSGGMKQVHETGRSTGRSYKDRQGYIDERRTAEDAMFGYGEEDSPESRPVMGYGVGSANPELLEMYGSVRLRLKDSVKERTTVTFDDSLDTAWQWGRNPPYATPSPWLDPSNGSIHASVLGAIGEWMRPPPPAKEWYQKPRDPLKRSVKSMASDFIEAQIHGGVDLEEIEEIIFPEQPKDPLVRRLKKLGVSFRVEPTSTGKKLKKHDTPKSKHKDHGPQADPAIEPHEVQGDPSRAMLAAVKEALAGSGLHVRMKQEGRQARSITILTEDERGFAQIVVWSGKYRGGVSSIQQQDMALPESERGKGTGGKMIAAMAAAYRAAGVSDVPIHVNANEPFWDHVKEKYPGLWKAPGIDESGPEPVAGYRLGSPPTAPPVPRGFKLANDVIQSRYRVKKDISGSGSPTVSSDVHTPAAGGDKKRPKDQDMLGVVGEELN